MFQLAHDRPHCEGRVLTLILLNNHTGIGGFGWDASQKQVLSQVQTLNGGQAGSLGGQVSAEGI